MRHIVMISQIPLWSMGQSIGGPAFEQTIRHLARHFRLSLVQPEVDYVSHADLPENVTLHAFPHRAHGLWRHVPKLGWLTDTLAWYGFRRSAWPIVRDLCSRGDVDLLYGYEIYGAPVASKAAKAFGLPSVSRYQGTLMTERTRMHYSRLRFHKHVAGLSVPADLVIMTNDGTGGFDYLVSVGHPRERIRFWMNGVDRAVLEIPTRDVRPEIGAPAGSHLLLTVSRLSFWKRVDRSIRLVAALRDRDVDAHLAVVGSGHEEGRLRELATALSVADRVHFAGGVARADLPSYYASADVLLSLYDFSNLANPVLEAMLLGTPIVAYDVGGTRDLVVDGVNGILIDGPDDVDALVRAVRPLLDDSERRNLLSRSAREWASQNLMDWDARMRLEIVELDSLIGGRSYAAGAPGSRQA